MKNDHSPFGCNISRHGSRQLELATTYPIVPRGLAKYRLDLYLFTPAQLGVTEERYGVVRFLRDLQSYIRYTPALIPLTKLVDRDCVISPITRLRVIAQDAARQADVNADKMLYEMRSLVNIYHFQLRKLRQLIKQGLQNNDAVAPERLKALINEVSLVLDEMRGFHVTLIDTRFPDSVRNGLRWADEAMSLKTEKEFYRLYGILGNSEGAEGLRNRLLSRLKEEVAHRKRMGYATLTDYDGGNNELFIYRSGILKKWAQSAMYMNSAKSRRQARVGHVLAGIAAAIAMAFAVAVTFLATQLFASYSLPWAFLIVISYIFKDRIKEILRGILLAVLPRMVADRSARLMDPAVKKKRPVGASRARVRFLKADNVPSGIRELRYRDADPFRQILPVEDVLHFQADTKLSGSLLLEHHERLESITEIIRINIDEWLREMDDPESELWYLCENKPSLSRARREYHINLVVELSACNGSKIPSQRFRHRLVLNREGILRIDPLYT